MILYILLAVMPMAFRVVLRWWNNTQGQLVRTRLHDHGRYQDDEPSDDIDVVCQTNGNGDEITSLAFLPDGERLVSLSKDDTTFPIRLWDMEDSREIETPMEVGSAVNAIAVSKDGKWIVSGGVDGNVAIWSTTSHQKQGASHEQHKHKRRITALDVSPDSSRVASASEDGAFSVWHIDSEPAMRLGLSLVRNEDPPPVSCLKFSPAGGRIATGYSRSSYYTIQIWHSWTGDQLTSFPTDGQLTRSIAWSSDGQRLFAGGPHGSIRCFDIATRRRLTRREDSRSDIITALYVSTTDQFLISASASARIIDVWDIKNPSAFEHLHSYRRSEVLSMAISPHERHIVHAAKDGRIYRRHLTKHIELERYFFHYLSVSSRTSEPALTCISNAVHQLWRDGKLNETEKMLSEEIERDVLVWYAHANRSLVRAWLQKWDEALSDAETAMGMSKLHGAQMPPVACIVKGIALCRQETLEGMAHMLCHDNVERVIECVKVELQNGGIELPDFLQSVGLCSTAQNHASLAASHLIKGDHQEALQVLSTTPDLCPLLHVSQANTFSFIFGCNIYDLYFMILQLKFQAYAVSGCIREAREILSSCDIHEEMEMRKGIFSQLIEKYGDKSMHDAGFDNAIAWYTMALDLQQTGHTTSELSTRCLEMFEEISKTLLLKDNATSLYMNMLSGHYQRIIGLYLKRSKAREEKKLVEEALDDVNEALQLDGQCQWAHERRSTLMQVQQNHDKGHKVPDDIHSKVKSCISRSLKDNKPRGEVINEAIQQIANLCPLVLIDVESGRLCDAQERKAAFEKGPVYQSLLSSNQDIADVVVRFFHYIMFSHRWGYDEPTFDIVSGKSVYDLDVSVASNKKLYNFCKTVQKYDGGYRWAWSDTCCINKANDFTYKKSIGSMYNWYKCSALTLVFLTDVSDSEGQPNGLEDSVWMTRAWTLQELLSPKIIHFYDQDWKLYRGDTSTNHKESPHIVRELADAIHISPHNLVNFSPDTLGVREKLRLASNRKATEEHDIAYSLFGIFKSDLTPSHGTDAETAFGLLLQEVVSRYREAAVLDWTGEPSKFHNCLPSHISVYGQFQYVIPPIADPDMKKRIEDLDGSQIQHKDAIEFYQRLSRLAPLHFANRSLDLPCITFPVIVTNCDTGTPGIVHLSASALGEVKVEFTASEKLPLQRQGDKLVLVYPWIRDVLARVSLAKGDDDIRASRMIAYLEQPFRALLFKRHNVHNEYERIATHIEIRVPGRKITSLEDMNVERLVVTQN